MSNKFIETEEIRQIINELYQVYANHALNA